MSINKINECMARNGILFLSFGLVLLALKQVSEASVWELTPLSNLIPPPPVSFSSALRIIHILISMIFMFAFLWIWRVCKLANFVKGWLKWLRYLIILLFLLFVLWLIPPIPVWFYTGFGKISIFISLIFMIAVFWRWLGVKLENLLEGQLKSTYWVIFWFVYTVGWLKGLSGIPAESFAFYLVFSLGFFWFLTIDIIFLKSSWQAGKNK